MQGHPIAVYAQSGCRYWTVRGGHAGGPSNVDAGQPLDGGLRSDNANGLRLGSLRAASDLELDPLVLLQRAVALRLDRGEVDEDVPAPVVGADEAVALLSVEPLHGPLRHDLSSWFVREHAPCASGGMYTSAAPGPPQRRGTDCGDQVPPQEVTHMHQTGEKYTRGSQGSRPKLTWYTPLRVCTKGHRWSSPTRQSR